MKIAFVNQPWTIAAPPKSSDSTGIWSYQVGSRLAKEHSVIYYGSPSSTKELASDLSIDYRSISSQIDKLLKIPKAIANKLNFNPKLPYFASAWFNWGYAWQIARDSAATKYDVIHIHNFSQFAPIIRDRNPHAKIVLHLHCEWVNRLDRDIIASRLAKVDLIISCSDYITSKIAARFPEYADICKTVNNGVNADYFVPSATPSLTQPHPPQILFVGRISPEKGVHVLIDAFVRVTKEYPQAVLTIAGPHIVVAKEFLFDLQPESEVRALEPFYSLDYLEYIKSQIPAHLSSQVKFTGSLPQEDLLPYYQQADIVINPSLSEAFGMSLVEAMATTTPVIATKIGGMPEVVDDGVTGLLTDPGNPQALAEAMLELIGDRDRAKVMGEAGREKVLQYYAWEQIAKSLIASYATIGVDVSLDDSQKAVAPSPDPENRHDRTAIISGDGSFGTNFFTPSRR